MKSLRSLDIARTDGHFGFSRLAEQFATSPYEYSKLRENFAYDLLRCLRLTLRLSDHNIYLSTGNVMQVLPLVLRKAILRKKFVLIVRSNDSFFHFCSFPPFQRHFLKWISRHIDGVIAISEMIKQYVEQNTDIPVRKVNVFLRDETYLDIQPDLSSKNIVAVGTDYPRKGNDILVHVDKRLREKGFEGQVFILGHIERVPKFIKKYAENQPRFHLVGYAEPRAYFERSCFYVHPARFEAAGNSVLEAMAAGLIPIVSENTGNKELVEQISSELIVKNDPRSFYQKISDLRNKDRSGLERLSKRAKGAASAYTFERIKKDFGEALTQLLETSLAKSKKSTEKQAYSLKPTPLKKHDPKVSFYCQK